MSDRKNTRTANPEYAKAMRELRRSNATTPHDPRPSRLRTRADIRRNAINDWMD